VEILIQPLNSVIYNRNDFDCGEIALNNWLEKTANQHQSKGISRTFVAVDKNNPSKILGYYSLSSSEVCTENFPSSKKLPARVPIVRLGRLAVALNFQGRGLGETLLLNALERVLILSENIGIFAVVVDAKNTVAAEFYGKYGFALFTDNPLSMVILLATIGQLKNQS